MMPARNHFSLAATGLLFFFGGVGLTALVSKTGKPSKEAKVTSEGVFIPKEQLRGKPAPQWKKGDARYVIVCKEGEEIQSLLEKIANENDGENPDPLATLAVNTLQTSEFPEALKILNRQAPESGLPIVSYLFGRWATHDPRAAWEQMARLPENQRIAYAPSILGSWKARNEPEALAFLDTLPNDWEKTELTNKMITLTALQNPTKAIDILKTASEEGKENLWKEVIGTISLEDPRKAIEFSLQLPDGTARQQALDGLVKSWGTHNPDEALNWIENLPQGRAQERMLHHLINAQARCNPDKAREILLRVIPSYPLLIEPLFYEPSVYSENDPKKAFQWSEKLQKEHGIDARHGILRQWFLQNPESALSYVSALPDKEDLPLGELVGSWISADYRKGMDWTTKNIETLGTTNLKDLIVKISQTNPYEALALYTRLTSDKMQIAVIDLIAEGLTTKDRDEAAKYLSSLPDGSLKEKFQEGHIRALSPSEAAKALNDFPQGELRDHLTIITAIEWAENDPRAAAEWIVKGGTRGEHLEDVVRIWAEQELEETANWINTLPKGILRDKGSVALTKALSDVAPNKAAEWAVTIEDEGLRRNAEFTVGRSWLLIDRPSAKAWIERSSLSEAHKESLLREP